MKGRHGQYIKGFNPEKASQVYSGVDDQRTIWSIKKDFSNGYCQIDRNTAFYAATGDYDSACKLVKGGWNK